MRVPGGLEDVADRLRAELDDRLVAEAGRHEQAGRPMGPDDQRVFAATLAEEWLAGLAAQRTRSGAPPLSRREEEAVVRRVLDSLFGAGPLQPLLDDPSVREIRMNGARTAFIVHRNGYKEEIPPLVDHPEEVVELVRSLIRRRSGAGGERRFDAAHPILDDQLDSGHRLFAVMDVSTEPSLVLRRHDWELTRLDLLGQQGMFPATVGRLLHAAVLGKVNVVISGGTGVGKTTLLRATCAEIPTAERLLVIEDSPELGLDRIRGQRNDVLTLCRRESNVEGVGAVDLPALVRAALRASPDRIIVGEVRGHEILPALLAATVGNEGSMTTVHARSAGDVWFRFATFAAMGPDAVPFEASAPLIAGAVDLIVHLSPRRVTGPDEAPGSVTSIHEVTGHDHGRVITEEILRVAPDGTTEARSRLQDATRSRLEAGGWPVGEVPGEERW
jgi:Flp pilus assembly CpaF family ATPase